MPSPSRELSVGAVDVRLDNRRVDPQLSPRSDFFLLGFGHDVRMYFTGHRCSKERKNAAKYSMIWCGVVVEPCELPIHETPPQLALQLPEGPPL